MEISEAGLALIKREERFMGRLYYCEAGRPTIGYGHVILHGQEHLLHTTLTEAEASDMLRHDVSRDYGAYVASRLHHPVRQHQFDAMVSLAYNIGTGGFAKSSVLTLANAGSTDAAAITAAFGLWNKFTDPVSKQRRVSVGLTARRAREAALYLS